MRIAHTPCKEVRERRAGGAAALYEGASAEPRPRWAGAAAWPTPSLGPRGPRHSAGARVGRLHHQIEARGQGSVQVTTTPEAVSIG
jgi:hypothetical protein